MMYHTGLPSALPPVFPSVAVVLCLLALPTVVLAFLASNAKAQQQLFHSLAGWDVSNMLQQRVHRNLHNCQGVRIVSCSVC
jgi:hypothetical protein